MSIATTTANGPMRQQGLIPVTCHKYDQKGHYRKDCPNPTITSPFTDQNLTYSPPTTVTQIVTAFYAVLQISLVTILKGLGNQSRQPAGNLERLFSKCYQNKLLPLLNSQ